MTKEDYMKLSKEKLAELLVERDKQLLVLTSSYIPCNPMGYPCDGTHCTNPCHDCIGCPKPNGDGNYTTTTTLALK